MTVDLTVLVYPESAFDVQVSVDLAENCLFCSNMSTALQPAIRPSGGMT